MSEPKPVEVGSKYNRLTILKEVDRYVQPNGRTRRMVDVVCECGVCLSVMLENLYSNYSQSCGCIGKEKTFKHGLTGTAFKDVHSNMKARCDNPQHPQYEAYGGRGIKYQESWKELVEFAKDMLESYSEGLSLDRKKVDGDYSKDNCRWTSMTVQAHNKRKKENTLFTFKGIRANNGCMETLVASIQIVGKSVCLASFSNEQDAAKAYDDASELLYHDRPNKTLGVQDWIYEKVKSKLVLKGVL